MAGQMDLEDLTKRRNEIRAEMTGIGDMRPGSLTPRFRKCGKGNCHCASDNSPGHGPSWSLTREVNGKTITKIISSPDAVESTKRQISEFRRFRELSRTLVEVNEKICDTKLEMSQAEAEASAKKGASKQTSSRKLKRNSPHS